MGSEHIGCPIMAGTPAPEMLSRWGSWVNPGNTGAWLQSGAVCLWTARVQHLHFASSESGHSQEWVKRLAQGGRSPWSSSEPRHSRHGQGLAPPTPPPAPWPHPAFSLLFREPGVPTSGPLHLLMLLPAAQKPPAEGPGPGCHPVVLLPPHQITAGLQRSPTPGSRASPEAGSDSWYTADASQCSWSPPLASTSNS